MQAAATLLYLTQCNGIYIYTYIYIGHSTIEESITAVKSMECTWKANNKLLVLEV